MYITQEQINKVWRMDREGTRVRIIQGTVGLPGKVVKRILLGEISTEGEYTNEPKKPPTKEEVEMVVNSLIETTVELASKQKLEPVILHEEAPMPSVPEPAPEPESVPEPIPEPEPEPESEPEPEPEPEPEIGVASIDEMDELIKKAIADGRPLNHIYKHGTIEKGGCLLWQETMIKGEPHIGVWRKFLPLYRLMYYKEFGTFPIREVSCKMHPRCIKPEHLE